METPITATVYPTFEGYLAKVFVPEGLTKTKSKCNTVVILDRSGSMGSNVARIYNSILPSVFEKLDYSPNDNISTICFDNSVIVNTETLNSMKRKNMHDGNTTYMSGAVKELQNYLSKIGEGNLRILTISDGELHDQETTVKMASELSKQIASRFTVNSQAVRFFTSRQQPDTRGLASVLQFNTINQSNLIDINSELDNDMIIAQLVSLFYNDGLNMSHKLVTNSAIFMSNPWSKPTDSVSLYTGDNTIWLKDLPSQLSVDQIKINFDLKDVPKEQIDTLLQPKLELFLNRLKVLKVVNTVESREEISQMMVYFSKLQQWIEMNNTDTVKLLGNHSLRGRIDYFKCMLEKRKKTIFQLMLEVANDDRVSKLNSAQQADYLRSLSSNRNTKALSRRALEDGIDFDDTVHKEVRAMHANLAQLLSVDDTNHSVSFYSHETTLSGIKSVCSLVDEGILDDLAAHEILQMINIVGVAVNAQIGDYPDAMCWRVNHIFPGCYLSVSDITMAHIQSNGQKLYPPGFEHKPQNELTTVIPIFEDLRIAKFLRKYAPSMLEYVSSIGMRRIIAGVNMTNCYTVCAGILKMVEELDKSKSTLNIDTFVKLVKTYDVFVGGYFDHVMPYIKEQDPSLMYFIGNNGLTNMIHPLYILIKTKNTTFIPQILRSIYSYEAYQTIKRIIKKQELKDKFVQETLHKILGINLVEHATPITPPFEPNPTPKHYNSCDIDGEFLLEFISKLRDFDYIALLPVFLSAVDSEDPHSVIRNVEPVNDETFCKNLGIEYMAFLYKFYSVVQSFVYTSKKSRVDDIKEQMKVPDLANKEEFIKWLKSYITKQYHDDYVSRLMSKTKEEKIIVKDKLVEALTNCTTVDQFINLMKNGLTYGGVNYCIQNNASLGFIEIQTNLLNDQIDVPDRLKKIVVFLTAKDSYGNVVWNNGNVLRIKLADFEWIFNKFNGRTEFELLKETYKLNPTHIYRHKPNRHGHSNDKPSYWAYGYETLEDMVKNISDEEWLEYKKIHHNCCGVNHLRSV
ncbi:hypothetical protein QJ857_gp0731 [Tupanvirus soda lake]|uniref:VWFA domain-containing protein n=2 Tax=Tupanvirus TaxID=2094720 RepID=A0A6N1NS24_9VIRU|nr:hypothetical protein QJ857_gp0731 [Tupanvirus soda lake]QKU35317.1 hypothetical protein [Tupanvirus soda lake]